MNMTFNTFLRLLYAVLLMNFSLLLNGQIYSPGAKLAKKIAYNTYAGEDSVFIFFSTEASPVRGSLKAVPPVPGNYSFEWSGYNHQNSGFDPVFYTETLVPQSSVSNLSTGGYRVRIFDGAAYDSSFYAWVFINEFRVEVTNKDEEGKIELGDYTCDFLIIKGGIMVDTFRYYDLNSNLEMILPNGFTFLWTSDNPGLIIPNADKILDPNITYLPPYRNTNYYLTAVDSFGMKDSDTVLYESIQVKAEFSFELFDKEKEEKYVDAVEPYEGGAPLDVRFTNKSINGNRFEWVFSDTVRSGFFENEISFDPDYQPEFSYEIPGEYYPALYAESAYGCVDSFNLENPVTVLPSELDVPNVFSPDGDDINRYFKVKHLSIKEFSIIIFNRQGKAVYRADVKDMYDWEGWDGTVLNTNNPAPPGAYFYIIEGKGYDGKRYYRKQYKGTVYLYRGGN